MLIVQKYGGTSLADAGKIRIAARRAAALVHSGHQVVLIVSAQGDTTDVLLEQAAQLTDSPDGRELDALLSTGEKISAALTAMAIQAEGFHAVSLTGRQAGIHTDDRHTDARITHINPEPIHRRLADGCIPVVAGFQGIAPDGTVTTLGRGGSDTTAVALAAALHADKCQIFTDVDGVYDKDPRKFSDARRYNTIDYDSMLALARSGAQVLHDRCIALAKQHRLPIEVLSAATAAPGTLVQS